MKIVVIDSYTLNPGDLSWKEIADLGDTQFFDRTSKDELVARCSEADIVLTNKVAFPADVLAQLTKLKLINVTATGFNIIDIEAAKKQGIVVCNVPDYGTDSVAQHTFALILELMNRVGQHNDSVKKGDWVNSADFSYALTPLTELKDKTIGLIGFGSIGQKTAEIARAFGMNVLYHTPTAKNTPLGEYRSLESLFSESDIVSLHLPLKADNKEFVSKELLSLMKPGAVFINTARGQLVNEQDLADALNSKRIAGAGIDVLSAEPPQKENPLLSADNCIITPHNAWMSKEARGRIMRVSFENLKAFLSGTPVNKVN